MAKNMYQKREQRKNNKDSEKSLAHTHINWYPGHMAKTKRIIREKIDQIDVIYEVIDARIPRSSKIENVEEDTKNKPRVLIMTKMDLCDLTVTHEWKKYYENIGYHVVMVDLEHNQNVNQIFQVTKEIMKPINDKRLEKGMSARKTRALIVGIPNAGKSTLINRLVGKKAVNVGNRPGVTKSLDWIRMNDSVELLDTPGILWPKFESEQVALNLASFTAIKEEVLPIYDVVCYILKTLNEYYPEKLKERYKITEIEEEDMVLTLDEIGKRRGCIIRGGEIDYDRVMSLILQDIKEGYIKGITFDRM